MNIISALKKNDCIRVSYGDKWLVYDVDEWIVYQHKYGAKKTITICRTDIQDESASSSGLISACS